jgi:ferritin
MKIIKKISEQIDEEIEGALWYAEEALMTAHEHPSLAKTLYSISEQELHHVDMLHEEVVKLIESHRREHGEPPAAMMAVYDYLHKKQIENVAKVKHYLEQFKA